MLTIASAGPQDTRAIAELIEEIERRPARQDPGRVVDALESSWYRVGFDRVHEARVSLGDSRLGAQLDKRLATLTVAGSGR